MITEVHPLGHLLSHHPSLLLAAHTMPDLCLVVPSSPPCVSPSQPPGVSAGAYTTVRYSVGSFLAGSSPVLEGRHCIYLTGLSPVPSTLSGLQQAHHKDQRNKLTQNYISKHSRLCPGTHPQSSNLNIQNLKTERGLVDQKNKTHARVPRGTWCLQVGPNKQFLLPHRNCLSYILS